MDFNSSPKAWEDGCSRAATDANSAKRWSMWPRTTCFGTCARAISGMDEPWRPRGALPQGFKILAQSGSIIAAAADASRKIWGLQFHPEVIHTHNGTKILENFLTRACGCKRDWTMSAFIESTVKAIAARGRPRTRHLRIQRRGGFHGRGAAGAQSDRRPADLRICGQRPAAQERIRIGAGRFFDRLHLKVVGVDARDRFLSRLQDVEDPEQKRKIIGEEFIRVFEEQARELGNPPFLVQGTLYPDVIESTSVRGPSAVIKSHHNVGGLPQDMKLNLIEPLRELFKDEVRKVGEELGMEPLCVSPSFPGPGLAVRILGSVTEERLALLRDADAIVQEEIEREAGARIVAGFRRAAADPECGGYGG